jgi:hypothetical protein
MQNLHFRALILMLTGAGIFFSGCSEKTVSPTGGSGAMGNIHGKVTLYDTLLDPLTNGTAARIYDASGVQVTVEGTSYSTLTDSSGEWHLDNIPSGIYTSVVFAKSGFAKQKSMNLGSTGGFSIANNGNEAVNSSLYRISLISCDIVIRPFADYTLHPSHDTVIVVNGNSQVVSITDTIDIPNGATTLSSRILDQQNLYYPEYIGVYFSTISNIDPIDGSTFLTTTGLTNPNEFTGMANMIILRSFLINAGFKPGQTIYCVAYCQGEFITQYRDMPTGMTIYTGLSPNHSEVKSFVLP